MKNEDTNKEWIYYETLVPGYVKKHSMRGIRERNAKLLDRLRKSTSPHETKQVKDLLAENNLPLAKYIAERFKQGRDWNRDSKDDAFSECCLAMVKFLNKMGTTEDDLNQRFFQVRLSQAMWAHLYLEYITKGSRRDLNLIPFSEENDIETKDAVHLNIPLVIDILNSIATCRNRDIFILYTFGNPDEGFIRPYYFNEIGEIFDLSSQQINNIVIKTKKKFLSFVSYLIKKGYYDYEDFFAPEFQVKKIDINLTTVPKRPAQERHAWFEKYL